jgi:hypothetical protein
LKHATANESDDDDDDADEEMDIGCPAAVNVEGSAQIGDGRNKRNMIIYVNA